MIKQHKIVFGNQSTFCSGSPGFVFVQSHYNREARGGGVGNGANGGGGGQNVATMRGREPARALPSFPLRSAVAERNKGGWNVTGAPLLPLNQTSFISFSPSDKQPLTGSRADEP